MPPLAASLERAVRALSACSTPEELQASAARVQQQLAAAPQDAAAAAAVLKAALAQLSAPHLDAGATDMLLQVCDACCGVLQRGNRAGSGGGGAACACVYSYVKKLVSLRRFEAALQQGRWLLQQLDAPGGTSAAAGDDVLVGACLNAVICAAELGGEAALPDLRPVNQAGHRLLGALRARPQAAAARHADVLTKYLFKLVTMLGAAAARQAASGTAALMQHYAPACQLLAQLYAATWLSSQAGALQQVVLRSCKALPSGLQVCASVALLQAAGAHHPACAGGAANDSGSSSSAGAEALCVVPAAVAIACLDVLVLQHSSSSSTAETCVRGLLWAHTSSGGLSHEACLLLVLLAAATGDALAPDAANSVAEAAWDAVHKDIAAGGRMCHCYTTGSSQRSAGCSRQGDAAEARSGGSGSEPSHAPACSPWPAADTCSAVPSLELSTWGLQRLSQLSLAGTMLALPGAALVLQLTRCGQHGPPPRLCQAPPTVKAVGLAARLLAQEACQQDSSSDAADMAVHSSQQQQRQRHGRQRRNGQGQDGPRRQRQEQALLPQPGAHSAKCAPPKRLLLQLQAVVDGLTQLPQLRKLLQQGCAGGGGAAVRWRCWLAADQLQRLSQELCSAAHSYSGSGQHSACACSTRAELLYLAWQCSCACACQQVLVQARSTNARAACSQADDCEALCAVLQHGRAYLGMLWRQHKTGSGSSSAASAAALQQARVQDVMRTSLSIVLQHGGLELVRPTGLQGHVEALLRLYGKLRCSSAGSCQPCGGLDSCLTLPAALQLLQAFSTAESTDSSSCRVDGGSDGSSSGSDDDSDVSRAGSRSEAKEISSGLPTMSNVDVLAWLEAKTLLQLAADPRLQPGAVVAAADELLQAWQACQCAAGWDDASFLAQQQLVKGMVLLHWPAVDSSSVEAARNEAVAALASAHQLLCRAITQAAAHPCQLGQLGRSGVGPHQPRSKATGTATQGAANKGSRQRCRGGLVQDVSWADVQALAAKHGHTGAAQLLAAAALSLCLSGLVQVEHLLGQQPALEHEPASGAGSSWAQAAAQLSASGTLFQLSARVLPQGASCAAVVRFPHPAASAAAQAWHIAGLQGWSCQQAFAGALEWLAPTLPPRQQGELQLLQRLMPQGATGSWLGQLFAQQAPEQQQQQQQQLQASFRDDSSSTGSAAGVEESAAGSTAPPAARSKNSTKRRPSAQRGLQQLNAGALTGADGGGTCIAAADYCACSLCCLVQASMQQCLPREDAGAPGWQSLQNAQAHLAAGQAAAAAGETDSAFAHARAAAHACCIVLAADPAWDGSRDDGRSSGDGGAGTALPPVRAGPPGRLELHGADGLGLAWHAAGLYMSSLLLLAELHDAAGNPAEASRALKELARLSSACHCSAMAAVSEARSSRVLSRMGEASGAAEAAAAAGRWLQLSHAHASEPRLVRVLIDSEVAAAAAACSFVEQLPTAQQQLQRQLAGCIMQLNDALADAAGHMQQQPPGPPAPARPMPMLVWRAVDLTARLQLQQAHSVALTQGLPEASSRLQHVLDAIQRGASHHRCHQSAWPGAQAALRLQQLVWHAPATPVSQPRASRLRMVGFGSNSSHCDLQAEFAGAAESDVQGQQQRRRRHESSAAGGHLVPGMGRPARKCISSGVGGSTAASPAQLCTQPAAWLSALLQVLPGCAHQPLLLQQACEALGSFLQAHGSVQGATACVQLQLGASTTVQHQLLLARRLADTQACAGVATDAEHLAAHRWQQQQQQLDLRPLLQALAAVGCPAASSDGMQHPDVSSSDQIDQLQAPSLANMLQSVDAIAGTWLLQQQAVLQPGTAVCSISIVRSDAEDMQHGRCVAAAAARSEHAAGALLLSRLPPACSAPGALPLLVALQPPPPTSRRPEDVSGMQVVLEELRGILADSSASMRSAGDMDSAEQRATWWKQRVSQDARMAQLLQHLDQDWLGPWRCLLMAPRGREVEAAAAVAARAFVADHFECVLEEVPRQLLSQLVAQLVAHLDACSQPERRQAAIDLCHLAQQRVDGVHVDDLVMALCHAHTQLPVATAAADFAARDHSSSGRSGNGSSANRSSSMESSGRGGGHSTSTAGLATPRMVRTRGSTNREQPDTIAKKAPQSRLKAMRRAARGTPDSLGAAAEAAAGDEDAVLCLAACMAEKLQLQPTGGQRAGQLSADGGEAAPNCSAGRGGSTRAPAAASRQVRFIEPPCPHGASRRTAVDKQHVVAPGLAGSPSEGAQHSTVPASVRRHAVGRRSSRAVPAAGGSSACSAAGLHGQSSAAGSGADVCVAARYSVAVPQQQQPASSSVSSTPPWRQSVLLLLDQRAQQLPWESCRGLKAQQMYRCPSLCAAAALSSSHMDGAGVRHLHLERGFYLLNPDGDLPETQAAFEAWLQQLGLQGVVGARPSVQQMVAALQHDVFLYFGHGSGEQYLHGAMQRLTHCAGSLLMGCSSGRLRLHGLYEPAGSPWAYLLAGAPVVIANLWDVTDRDIDRFACAVLQQWSSAPDTGDGGCCAAVGAGRLACRLPCLVGAAPVCYGLPVGINM